VPALELRFDPGQGTVSYRWKVDEPGFQMPVRVGKRDSWRIILATTDWQTMPTSLKENEFEVATDLYFVDVVKQ
jgi:hypothetical protein